MQDATKDEAPSSGIAVAAIGSFFIRGRPLEVRGVLRRPRIQRTAEPAEDADANGDFERDQAYVQFVKLCAPQAPYPVVLWHGGSLTGAMFESTPDGRPGWQWEFLRAGYDVYVVDAPASGRAPWSRYPEVFPAEPRFRTKKMLWETFRIGPVESYQSEPSARRAVDGTRFPTEAFDDFAMQVVPRFTHGDDAIAAAMRATITHIGRCVLLTHSAAGPFGFSAAAARPDLVAAHVTIEPSGGALGGTDLEELRRVPHLFVWGDGFAGADPTWRDLIAGARATHEALRPNSTWMDLPARGIAGNSHMLMLDTNSHDVFTLIDGWLRSAGREQ